MPAPRSRTLPTPPDGVFRVATGAWPFEFRLPREALSDETDPVLGGNRWDDPLARFATLYCASSAEAAFGETIARYRERPGLLERIDSFLSSPADPDYDPPLLPGRVPDDYFDSRYLGNVPVDADVRFVDVDDPATHAAARPMLRVLRRFGVRTIDRSTFLSPDRRVTRTLARHYWNLAQSPDHHDWRGLRFVSRLAPDWECWAIWEPSPLRTTLSAVVPVTRNHPGLVQAAQRLGVELP